MKSKIVKTEIIMTLSQTKELLIPFTLAELKALRDTMQGWTTVLSESETVSVVGKLERMIREVEP